MNQTSAKGCCDRESSCFLGRLGMCAWNRWPLILLESPSQRLRFRRRGVIGRRSVLTVLLTYSRNLVSIPETSTHAPGQEAFSVSVLVMNLVVTTLANLLHNSTPQYSGVVSVSGKIAIAKFQNADGSVSLFEYHLQAERSTPLITVPNLVDCASSS